jgi:peptidyl-dipeptidase Dcp
MSETDHTPHAKAPAKAPDASPRTASDTSRNPLLEDWTTSGGVPPFDRIAAEHFTEAYAHALAEHEAEIAAIASDPARPSFANTIVVMELSGRTLDRVGNAFHLLAGAHSNDALLGIERDIAPQVARHWNAIHTHAALFRRINGLVREIDDLGLDAEQKRVLERYHTDFRRAGAGLDDAAKKRLAEIIERLAALGTAFSQNVLTDEQAFSLRLHGEAELAGLPDFTRETLRSEARERGIDGYAVTLSRSTVEPFLQFSDRRDLREKVFHGFVNRGDNGGSTDNKAIIAEMVRLRAERAQLLGYADFAHYRLDDAMAKTPSEVRTLLDAVWTPARKSALADRDAMQALVQEEGGNFKLEAWDWRYYAEKLRYRVCNFDEAAIKPYLSLDRIIEAAFYTAQRLFGLRFGPAPNVPVWHPDVRVWRVSDADGNEIGLFFGDYFARGSKRSGAWMTALRDQQKLAGHTPLIVNVCNFAKAPAGEPTLLSFEDARTLFHEFGHALHGLLSAVTYPTISGTNVATDFVELPSQLYEHWLQQPELLRRFARHYQTGAAMPEELLQRLVAARNFNKGFATVEYIACASADLDLHSVLHAKDGNRALDPSAFEAQSLADMGMPSEIVMRHRLPHFAHIFAGGGYAAGYYSYMWSEVLDADAFSAFEETGDIFDPATAKRLHQSIYAAGGLQEPAEAYKAFRGRLPTADALLRKRGFVAQDTKVN